MFFQTSRTARMIAGEVMPQYASGDFVKVEFRDDGTGESKWMWVRVDA